jgi:hypothetical protein
MFQRHQMRLRDACGIEAPRKLNVIQVKLFLTCFDALGVAASHFVIHVVFVLYRPPLPLS